MNLKDKRTRRLCAMSASAAVIAAGGVVAASVAGASGTLALSTGNAFATLDVGQKVPVSVQTLTTGAALGGAETFTVTALGTATSALAKTTTSAQLQTALNAIPAVATAGGVTVTDSGAGTDYTTSGHAFVVTFNVPGARAAITVADTHAGNPNVVVAQTTTGAATLTAALANATFGTKVTTPITTSGNLKLTLDSYTAPAGVTIAGTPSLLYSHANASGGATGPTTAWTPLYAPAATTATSASLYNPGSNIADTNDTFLSANLPGTYTFHFADDLNTIGTGDDVVSPTVTMTVKDAYAATTETVDDWSPTVTNTPSASAIGAPVTTSVDLAPLTLLDTRSSVSGAGVLGSKIAALVGVGFNGAGPADAAGTAVTLGTTAGTRRLASGTTNAAGTMTSTAYFDRDGNGTINDVALSTATTSVTSNTVAALALAAATGQTANVTGTGAATKLRTAVDTVTYTATATSAAPAPVAGATVYFRLGAGSGTALTDLTANGAVVPSSGDVAATTDADGVAKLVVKSTKTANTNAYTVDASSNGFAGTQITATYTTPAATTVKTAGNIAGTVAGTVTITGQLVDQWSQVFTPLGGGQATLNIDQSNSTYASSDFSHIVDITNGAFSYTYTDITGNAAARTDAYRWTAGGVNGSGNDTVKWLTSTAVGSASFTSLAGNAFPLAAAVAVTTNGAPAGQRKALVGVLKDGSATALPFTSFTLTATPGVYFENALGAYVTTLTARTSSSGALQVADDQSGSDVKVLLTKAGPATITVTAGGKTATGAITVSPQIAGQAYAVTVTNATGIAGKNVTVGGKVTDAFGNPVPGAQVDLALSGSTFGAFLTSATPLTDSAGNFSAIFISGDSDKGTVSYTATLHGQTANATANAAWATGGLTIADGVYTATGTIAVSANTVTLTAPARRTGAGSVTLKGTAAPGALVDVYRKDSSGLVSLDSVTADGTTGAWTAIVSVAHTTVFIAKTTNATSLPITVKVTSTVKISAKAARGGVIKLTVSGGPSKRGTITVWITHGRKVTKVVSAVTGGAKTWTLKPGKGVTSFKATYKSTGCDTSSTVRASARIR